MKKFSKLTKQKIGEQPKEVTKVTEMDIFKGSVNSLLEKFLSVRTYGPIDRYLRQGSIKIVGQDMFIEALLDFISENNLKEQVKLLESLKHDINDWNVIDVKIEETLSNHNKIEKDNSYLNARNKVKSLIQNYSDDKELLYTLFENVKEKSIKDDSDKKTNYDRVLDELLNDEVIDNEVYKNLKNILGDNE